MLLFVGSSLQPTEPGDEVRFTIPRGVSSGRIANILEQHGIVRDGTIFAYYLKYKGIGDQFQAGEYAMAPGISIERMIEMLNNGETVPPEMMKFTIAEGLRMEQIAEIVGGFGKVDKTKFLEIANDPTLLKAPQGKVLPAFVQQLAELEDVKYKLEGYLFPDTYEMLADSTEQDVMFRLVREFGDKLARLPEGWEDQMEKLGVSFHEVITIASLIEREVVVDEERPIVASVIYNRLSRKMNLEIDATVQYALPEHKDRLLYADLEVDSPYNTYKHSGLPPGPIASPSLASIQAALYPEETKYLFYVTKKDGTQSHLFAETFKGHQQNIAKSNNNARDNQE